MSTAAYQTAQGSRTGRFWDYDAIWDDYPQLSRTALVVRTYIARHADATGQWTASYGQLAEGSRMSRRQAIRAVQELVGEGLLSVEQRADRQGRSLANRFRLLLPASMVGVPADTAISFGVGANMSPWGDTPAPIRGIPVPLEPKKQQQGHVRPRRVVVSRLRRRQQQEASHQDTGAPATPVSEGTIEEFRRDFEAATGLALSQLLVRHLGRLHGLAYLYEKLALTKAALDAGRVRGDPRAYWNAAVHQDWKPSLDVAHARAEVEAAAREQAAAQEAEERQRLLEHAEELDRFEASLAPEKKAAAMAEAAERLPEATRGWPESARTQLCRQLYRTVLAEWMDTGSGSL